MFLPPQKILGPKKIWVQNIFFQKKFGSRHLPDTIRTPSGHHPEQEVKADNPSNTALQSCRIPPDAGGLVDVLLGIKYTNIFPIPVHNLPSGLTIYRSQIASHGGDYDCCIGGPHESFTVLTSLAGGASQLLSHFVVGLRAYRQWGPSKLHSLCMSNEEVTEAVMMNTKEGEILEFLELEELGQQEEDEIVPVDQFGPIWSNLDQVGPTLTDLDQVGPTWTNIDQSGSMLPDVSNVVQCCKLCLTGHATDAKVSSYERIRDLKRFYELHESGLEVEYRCPACRECAVQTASQVAKLKRSA